MQTRVASQTSAGPELESTAARRIDRLTMGVALFVLAVVAVGIAVAVIVARTQPALDLSTPEGVTLAYESAIQGGEPDAAWDLLSTEAQAATTRQEFLARAAGLANRGDARLAVENVRTDGNAAHLDVTRTMPTSGFLGLGAGSVTVRSPVTLVRQSDGWRISVPSDPFVIMQPPGGRP